MGPAVPPTKIPSLLKPLAEIVPLLEMPPPKVDSVTDRLLPGTRPPTTRPLLPAETVPALLMPPVKVEPEIKTALAPFWI